AGFVGRLVAQRPGVERRAVLGGGRPGLAPRAAVASGERGQIREARIVRLDPGLQALGRAGPVLPAPEILAVAEGAEVLELRAGGYPARGQTRVTQRAQQRGVVTPPVRRRSETGRLAQRGVAAQRADHVVLADAGLGFEA